MALDAWPDIGRHPKLKMSATKPEVIVRVAVEFASLSLYVQQVFILPVHIPPEIVGGDLPQGSRVCDSKPG